MKEIKFDQNDFYLQFNSLIIIEFFISQLLIAE